MQAEACNDFLTWLVSPLPMTGPTMPGIVAKVLVIDKRMPAYLQTQIQHCRFSKESQLQVEKGKCLFILTKVQCQGG